MSLNYPARLSLAQLPTPLQPLDRMSARYGGAHRIWVKRDDLTGSTLSGNKVRKLEFVAAHALETGCDTLITCGGLQSNHCRATALVGAQLGLKVHLILRGEPEQIADGNLLLGHLAGAQISCHPAREYFANLQGLFADQAASVSAAGGKALCIPTGASDGLGLWGYIAGARELADDLAQLNIAQAHIVCATGSGGTQAGLTLGAALHQQDWSVWGVAVCDDEAWFLNKVAEDIADWEQRYHSDSLTPAWTAHVLDGYVGPGYGRAEPEVFDLIAELARTEGLILDPVYTGKAFLGLLKELQAGRFSGVRDIVFMHTGGVYGVFPQREQFQQL